MNIARSNVEPLSIKCVHEIKKKINGEWFAFISDDMDDNFDFYFSNINGGRFVIFNIGDKLFQVCQIS